MKKKILILGVSGQDGSLLAEHLIKKKKYFDLWFNKKVLK